MNWETFFIIFIGPSIPQITQIFLEVEVWLSWVACMNACKLWSLPFFNVSVVLNVSFLSCIHYWIVNISMSKMIFCPSCRPKEKLLNKDASFRNCPWTSFSTLQHFPTCKIWSWLLFTLHGCQERWMRQFEVSSGGCNYNDVLDKKGTSFLFILVIILAHQRLLV